MTERTQHVNTINAILALAEQEIQERTGLKMRVVLVEDLPAEQKTPGKLLHVIASALDMFPSDFVIKTRKMGHVELRQMGVLFLTEYHPEISLTNAGRLAGLTSYSDAQYALKAAKEKLEGNDIMFTGKHQMALEAVTQWLRD
jgi:hypothetical protein